eukprot:symbB.v1.2.025367.t1/scaffold2417.1/size139139/2
MGSQSTWTCRGCLCAIWMVLVFGKFRSLASVSLQRWKIQVAYDGSDFLGWQSQGNAGARTVHSSLLAALIKSHPVYGRGQAVAPQLVGCSRTDRGVHAEDQVAHCDLLPLPALDGETLKRRCNHRLPHDLRVVHVQAVSQDFHARKSALRKCYRYDLLLADEATPFEARFVWPVGQLDIPTLQAAADQWDGRELNCRPLTVHWRSSCKDGTDVYDEDYYGSLQKQLSVRLVEEGRKLSIYVEADAFLYRMVRVIITALVAAGRQIIHPCELQVSDPEMLEKTMARIKSQCQIAPANGLFLQKITYGRKSLARS